MSVHLELAGVHVAGRGRCATGLGRRRRARQTDKVGESAWLGVEDGGLFISSTSASMWPTSSAMTPSQTGRKWTRDAALSHRQGRWLCRARGSGFARDLASAAGLEEGWPDRLFFFFFWGLHACPRSVGFRGDQLRTLRSGPVQDGSPQLLETPDLTA